MIAHHEVRQAFVDAFRAATPLAGGNVFKQRKRATKEGASALVVRLLTAAGDPGEIKGAPTDWKTQIAVEAYDSVTATDTDECGDEPASALLSAAHDRLMADPSLGGKAMDVRQNPDLNWDAEDHAERLGCVVAIYTVLHRTTGASLNAA